MFKIYSIVCGNEYFSLSVLSIVSTRCVRESGRSRFAALKTFIFNRYIHDLFLTLIRLTLIRLTLIRLITWNVDLGFDAVSIHVD